MDLLYLIFHACLRLRFLKFETNHGTCRPVPGVCRILCSNVRGLAVGTLCDLTVASSQYDTLLCSETLVSDMRHVVLELLVPRFGHPVLLCQGKMPRARGMAPYVRNGYGAFRRPKFECGCCEIWVFRVCGVRPILYVFSLYHNPDLDDRFLDCLQASMSAVLTEDIRASLLVVGDLNGHHQVWLGSTTTIRHGVGAFDFATVSVAISWLSVQPMCVVEQLAS